MAVVELFEVEIDQKKAIAETKALKEEFIKQKVIVDELKKSQGELSEEYIEANASLKSTQQQLRANERLTQNVIAANNANTGSIDQLRKQLSVVSVQWARLNEDERRNSDEGKRLTAQKLQLTNALKKEERATGDARRNVGNYNESVGQSIGLMGQFVPAVGRAATGAQALGRAFTVALGPIGLVVAAIAAVVTGLKAFFTASEEGEDAWDKFSGAASIALGNIQDRLSDLTESIIEDPKKAFNDFLDFFRNSFGKQLEGAWDLIVATFQAGFAQINLGYQKFVNLFTDNTDGINEAQKSIEEANNAITKSFQTMAQGATNALEPVTDFYNETNKEIEENNKLLDRQAQLNRFIRNAQKQNAKDELEVAKLRNQVSQRQAFSAQERLDFLNQAIELEGKILDRNLQIAQTEVEIARQRATFSKNTREDNDKLAQAEVKLFNVRTANYNATRRLEEQRSTLLKEIQTETAKNADNELKILEELVKEEMADLADFEKDILSVNKSVTEETARQRQQAIQQRQIEYEAELAAAQDNIFRRLDLEREGLETQRQQEIEFAESIGADTTAIEKKYSLAREAINQAEQEAKLSIASGFTKNLAQIAGEGTAIGKAAAVASTTIDTYASATAAYKSLAGIPVVGPALGAVAAAAAVASGLANVKKILSVDTGLPGGKSTSANVSASTPTTPTLQSTNPDINQGIISRETLQNQQQITVQPTLVIDDVTSKQTQQSANQTTSVI